MKNIVTIFFSRVPSFQKHILMISLTTILFSATTTAPITISWCIIIISKLKGYKIKKGNIFQKQVQDLLENYHPTSLALLRFFLLPEWNVYLDDTIIPIYIPSFDEEKVVFQRQKTRRFIDCSELADSLNTSIRKEILSKVNKIKFNNKEIYYAENPENDWRIFNSPQKSRNVKKCPTRNWNRIYQNRACKGQISTIHFFTYFFWHLHALKDQILQDKNFCNLQYPTVWSKPMHFRKQTWHNMLDTTSIATLIKKWKIVIISIDWSTSLILTKPRQFSLHSVNLELLQFHKTRTPIPKQSPLWLFS